MQKIILREPKNVMFAIQEISKHVIDPDNLVEVIIKPYKTNRSLQQNALYWSWMTTMGDTLGYDKEAMHQTMMRQFLVPVLHDTVDGVIEEYSTKHLTAPEMSDYMEKISFLAGEYSVSLPKS